MASESFLAGDLRRAGTEAKRDHDHKAKWAYGGRIALPQKFHVEMGMKLPLTRPIPEHQLAKRTSAVRFPHQFNLDKFAHHSKVALRYDIHSELLEYGTSDSSAEEDTREPNAAGNADENLEDDQLFSYEASGHSILAAAVAKAEERFEAAVTEKLVKEYEFVCMENEAGHGYVADDDDDDFELVDHVTL
ncbi:hypothetical protein VTN02DRAFT_3025 [Thermoascus thermophilus]